MRNAIAILFFFFSVLANAVTRHSIDNNFSDLIKDGEADQIEANCLMVDKKREITIKAWKVSSNPTNFEYEVHYTRLSSGSYVFKSVERSTADIILWVNEINEKPPRPFRYMTVRFGSERPGVMPGLSMDFNELLSPFKIKRSGKEVTMKLNHFVTFYSPISTDYEILTGANCEWKFSLSNPKVK